MTAITAELNVSFIYSFTLAQQAAEAARDANNDTPIINIARQASSPRGATSPRVSSSVSRHDTTTAVASSTPNAEQQQQPPGDSHATSGNTTTTIVAATMSNEEQQQQPKPADRWVLLLLLLLLLPLHLLAP